LGQNNLTGAQSVWPSSLCARACHGKASPWPLPDPTLTSATARKSPTTAPPECSGPLSTWRGRGARSTMSGRGAEVSGPAGSAPNCCRGNPPPSPSLPSPTSSVTAPAAGGVPAALPSASRNASRSGGSASPSSSGRACAAARPSPCSSKLAAGPGDTWMRTRRPSMRPPGSSGIMEYLGGRGDICIRWRGLEGAHQLWLRERSRPDQLNP
jgi:hypothetical protein